MKTISSKDAIERLKKGLNLSSDNALAELLGISKATLSNWKSRNSIDIPLVFSKCEQISIDWLLTGHGPILKTKGSNQSYCVAEDAIPDHKDKENKAIYPHKQEENSITEAIRYEPSVSYTPSKGAPYYDVDFLGGFDLTFNDQTVTPEYNIDFKPFNKPGVTWVNITGIQWNLKSTMGILLRLRNADLRMCNTARSMPLSSILFAPSRYFASPRTRTECVIFPSTRRTTTSRSTTTPASSASSRCSET